MLLSASRASAMQIIFGLCFTLGVLTGQEPAVPQKTPIGKAVANFKLQDYRGAWHALEDYSKNKVVVVAFLGAECPLAKRYASRLAELDREFGQKGVAFLGIDANQQDALTQIAHLARTHHVEFPILKDVGNAVADQLGAQRTPEVFMLDNRRVVRYWGRVDDQFGVGYSRPQPTRRDLVVALEELLAGKPVTQPVTPPEGCVIGRVRRNSGTGDVTYSKQIARVFQSRCVGCHRPGSIGPFALNSYKQAAGWAATIREVIEQQRMPPWHADPKYGVFANDARMPEGEKKLVYEWIDHGCPEGDPKDLPKPIQFVEDWRIPKPDLIFSMPEPFTVPATGDVPYQYFTVDPGFTEDKWVKASEGQPGNRSVVHHMIVFVLPPGSRPLSETGGFGGEFLAAGVPGLPPMILPEGDARFVPAGSKLVFQMHYTPNGTVQTDQSRFGLVFADPKSVVRELKSNMALNFKFQLPPGANNYAVKADFRFGQDSLLYSLMPHMHLRGKSFRFEAVYPDRKREILLDVPRYTFDWQNQYVLAKPKLMPEGTVLHCVAHFDNSEDNLSNPDPRATVTWGDQTWQEMMVGYFDAALAYQDLRAGPPKIKSLGAGEYEVQFQYPAPPGTKSVYLAGTFNDWKTDANKMDGPDSRGAFTTKLKLKAERYEYKFVIEGRIWKADPANRKQAGYYNNSVVMVGEHADRVGSGKGKFTIGKETTFVTGPVDEDGYIDYAAALNERLGQGVTPEKNATVLLWKALGPHPEGATMPPEFFQLLGIQAPPEKGEYFIDLDRFMKDRLKVDPTDKAAEEIYRRQDRVIQRAWKPKEHQDLAAWLDANANPLALAVEATKRPQYFSPLVPTQGGKKVSSGLLGVILPGVQKCRGLANALAARAMLRVGESRYDDAWQDLLACHRLGRLVGRGGTLIEGLIGIAIDNQAARADLAYLERVQTDAKRIESCLRDLQKLPPTPELADKVNLGERLAILDMVMSVDRRGIKYLEGLTAQGQANDSNPLGAFLAELILKDIDWDPALRNANQWYDRMAAAARGTDRSTREKEWNQVEADLKALRTKVVESGGLGEALVEGKDDPKVRGKAVGNVIICLMTPAIHKVQGAVDRIKQTQDNLRLAFALAWFHCDHGHYPKNLDALAPKYLERIPQDMFSGKALIYRPSENGYLLYSVGVNGKDDGGRGYDDQPRGDDLVIRMPLPEQK
jgi:peroxiredoxin/mono/diheme cytochrome c family protein